MKNNFLPLEIKRLITEATNISDTQCMDISLYLKVEKNRRKWRHIHT